MNVGEDEGKYAGRKLGGAIWEIYATASMADGAYGKLVYRTPELLRQQKDLRGSTDDAGGAGCFETAMVFCQANLIR